jgi:cysteine desulfurase
VPTPAARPLIYLDHNATTPLRAEVCRVMAEALPVVWGNPSSTHGPGRRAREAVEQARRQVAALIGASPEEIVFTSGGTEGDNLAVRGLAVAARAARRAALAGRPAHVVSSPLEHPAVQAALDALAADGFEVTRVPVGSDGAVTMEAVRAALRPEQTVLVTLAAANHELGNVAPWRALAEAAHEAGALFHADAVQAAGRIPFHVGRGGIDGATLSAHKLGGPKGVGAVYLRRGVELHPFVAGGHQERERRGGTENVVGIIGFGEACRLAAAELEETAARVGRLRDRLEARLLALPGSRRHGDPARRVPGTSNLGFEGAPGELVMVGLDLEGVCVSTGAACTSGSLSPSPVVLALGLAPAGAREAVRFSLGRETTEAEVDRAAALVELVVARVRTAGGGAR